MKRNWKSILALLLAVSMVFTLDTSVMADEDVSTVSADAAGELSEVQTAEDFAEKAVSQDTAEAETDAENTASENTASDNTASGNRWTHDGYIESTDLCVSTDDGCRTAVYFKDNKFLIYLSADAASKPSSITICSRESAIEIPKLIISSDSAAEWDGSMKLILSGNGANAGIMLDDIYVDTYYAGGKASCSVNVLQGAETAASDSLQPWNSIDFKVNFSASEDTYTAKSAIFSCSTDFVPVSVSYDDCSVTLSSNTVKLWGTDGKCKDAASVSGQSEIDNYADKDTVVYVPDAHQFQRMHLAGFTGGSPVSAYDTGAANYSISADGITIKVLTADNYYAVVTDAAAGFKHEGWQKCTSEYESLTFSGLAAGTAYYVQTMRPSCLKAGEETFASYAVSHSTISTKNPVKTSSGKLIILRSGVYYYGSRKAPNVKVYLIYHDSDKVYHNEDVTNDVTLEYSTDRNFITTVDYRTVPGKSLLYVRAKYGSMYTTGNCKIPVRSMPLTGTVSYNRYSVRYGEADTTSGNNITFVNRDGDTVSQAEVDRYFTYRSGALEDTVLSSVQKNPLTYHYHFIGSKDRSNRNYRLTVSGSSYYVLPVYTVSFIGMQSGRTVSDNIIVSSNAAANIDKYKLQYRYTAPALDYSSSKPVTLPTAVTGETEEKMLTGWAEKTADGKIKAFHAPGAKVTISDDTVFIARFTTYIGNAGEYSSLSIDDIPEVVYTGTKHVSSTEAKVSSSVSADLAIKISQPSANRTLVEGTDYTLTYKNNVNVYSGTESDLDYNKKAPQVTVKFKGEFKNEAARTLYFRIVPCTLTGGASLAKNAYQGGIKAAKVAAAVMNPFNAGKKLAVNRDYTVGVYDSEDNYVTGKTALENDAAYTVKIQGIKNYKGTVIAGTFQAYDSSKKDAAKLSVTLSGDNGKKATKFAYRNGTPVKPDYTVKNGKNDITESGYFGDPVYSNCTEPGKASLTLTVTDSESSGLYGSKTVYYTIIGKKLPQARVSSGKVAFTGQDTSAEGMAKVSVNGLVNGTDYIIKKASAADEYILPGKHKLTVSGLGIYSGSSRIVTYSVERMDMKDLTISYDQATGFIYERSGVKPVYTVTDKGGRDMSYMIRASYKNNKKTGTMTMVLSPVGKYAVNKDKDKYAKDYTIKEQAISAGNIALNFTSGSDTDDVRAAKAGMLTVKDNEGNILKAGKDYTAEITENTSEGTATVNVTAKAGGNFTGTASKTERTLTALLSTATVRLSDSTKKVVEYNATAQTPAVKVTIRGSAEPLTEGTDYQVIYSNNVYPGTATIIVKGIDGGKYGGSNVYAKNKVTFRIRLDESARK